MKYGAYIAAILILTAGGLLAQTAIAPAGEGTSGNPYQIATWQNLYWLSQNPTQWDKYFIQTANIDLTAASPSISTWDSNKGWTPIGNSTTKFTGSYDGQNHIIKGIYINRSNISFVGFFGYVQNAVIKNLGLVNVDITCGSETYDVAALIGYAESYQGSTSITNCFASGSVTGYSAVGGLIGGTNGYDNSCTIEKSYSMVNVKGNMFTGGFIGIHYNNAATITDCYSRGNVTRLSGSSSDDFGAFAGKLHGATIQKCYTTGSVYYENATNPTDKGFIGINQSGTYSNNFWDSQASNQTSAIGAESKTTAEMKTQSTFTGWDFTNTWAINQPYNDGYPYLQWAVGVDQSLPVELTFFTAITRRGAVVLTWRTESETENLGFIIEKRLQVTGNWSPVADYTTCAALAGHGSTSEAHEYSYTDAAVIPGATYVYRLADVDYSGKVTRHKEVAVKVETDEEPIPLVFGLQKAFPNPFNPSLTILYGLSEDGPMSLTVYNLRGQMVETLINAHALKGNHSITWQPQNLSAGIYLVRLQSGKRANIQKVVFVK